MDTTSLPGKYQCFLLAVQLHDNTKNSLINEGEKWGVPEYNNLLPFLRKLVSVVTRTHKKFIRCGWGVKNCWMGPILMCLNTTENNWLNLKKSEWLLYFWTL